jgi:hypothetical protein
MKSITKTSHSKAIHKQETHQEDTNEKANEGISEMGYNSFSFQFLSSINPDLLMLITDPEANENT